jgi:hypothetical protein
MKISLLFIIVASTKIFSQDVHHQMQSSQGTSSILTNGYYVSQTIGQQSVIGTSETAGLFIGQGFQQSFWHKYISDNVNNGVTVKVYPNPFVDIVNFQFSDNLNANIDVSIYDVQGRIVFQKSLKLIDNKLSVELSQLPETMFLVRLSAPNYSYYTQIIKKI